MCGGFAAGALAVLAVGLVTAIYKRTVEASAVLTADPSTSTYKQMFPLRSYFRLKQPVDEEYESVTSQFFTFPGLERRIVNGPRRHSNPPTG